MPAMLCKLSLLYASWRLANWTEKSLRSCLHAFVFPPFCLIICPCWWIVCLPCKARLLQLKVEQFCQYLSKEHVGVMATLQKVHCGNHLSLFSYFLIYMPLDHAQLGMTNCWLEISWQCLRVFFVLLCFVFFFYNMARPPFDLEPSFRVATQWFISIQFKFWNINRFLRRPLFKVLTTRDSTEYWYQVTTSKNGVLAIENISVIRNFATRRDLIDFPFVRIDFVIFIRYTLLYLQCKGFLCKRVSLWPNR